MRISLFETGFECEPHMGLAEFGGFRAYLMGLGTTGGENDMSSFKWDTLITYGLRRK